MDTPEDERTKLISCLGAFRQYWGTLPQVYTRRGRFKLTYTVRSLARLLKSATLSICRSLMSSVYSG